MKSRSWMAAQLPVLLMVGGCGLIAVALAVEWLLPGSSPGLGRKQLLLLAAGLVLAGLGAARHEAARARLVHVFDVKPDDVVLGLSQILLLAAIAGAACAIAETALLMFLRFGMGRIIRVGPDVIWMSAVLDIAVLAAFGIALRAIGAVVTKVRTARVVTFLFALIAVDTVIHRVSEADRASDWSKWILAAGVALVITRVAERVRARRGGRRFATAVAATALALTAASLTSAGVRESLARARLGAASAGNPNVLLIILDTVRAASLSLYGHARPTTPQLERFAASGVVFDRAIAPSSWTLPSHASIFTGRDPNELSADWWIPLDGSYPTLAEVLSGAGYATAAFSANLAYANRETGLARGFARFDDYTRTPGEALRTSMMLRRALRRFGLGRFLNDDWNGRRTADHVNGTFLDWLERAPADRPFFAFLNYMDGHDPYHAPPPFDTLYAPASPFLPLDWGRPPSEAVVRSWTDWYDRSITYLDDRLGRLFDALAERGALDNTIVVVTADHGELLGEFQFMRHGSTLYMPVIHVPLIVRGPSRVPAGVRVAEPVAVRDIAATILDLAGVAGGTLGGESLAGAWLPGAGPREAVYSETREAIRVPARYPNAAADLHSLVDGDVQYIHSTDGPEELFRLAPGREESIAVDTGAAVPLLERMRRDLERWVGGEAVARRTEPRGSR
jgi:arylsulfatase A-like enzyme